MKVTGKLKETSGIENEQLYVTFPQHKHHVKQLLIQCLGFSSVLV